MLYQRLRPSHTLLVATAVAVDHQQWNARARLLNLDGAAARGHHLAALCGALDGNG